MKTKVKKTIELSAELDRQLKEFAGVTGVTSSTIIRLALMNFLPQNKSLKAEVSLGIF